MAEPTDEADRGRHPGFSRHEGLAGDPGNLSLSLGHFQCAYSGSWPIDILAVPDTLHLHDLPLTQHLVHDAIIANTDAIGVLGASQFLGAVRMRLLGELLDSGHNSGDFR